MVFFVLFVGESGVVCCLQFQCDIVWQVVGVVIYCYFVNGVFGDQLVQCGLWVIVGDVGCIGVQFYWYVQCQYFCYWWGMFYCFFVVVIDKIFVLEGYLMLYCNIVFQCFYLFNVMFGNGFGMIEELVQVIKWDIVVYFFKYVQYLVDGFIVGGMQVEWLVMFYQMVYYLFQFIFYVLWQIWLWLQEIFKICC